MGAVSRCRADDSLIGDSSTRSWKVEWRSGQARFLHDTWPPADQTDDRVVAVCEAAPPATLVLGSTQTEPVLLDTEALRAGRLSVTRRTSGGGAVLIDSSAQVWIDVWLPRADVLFEDDVINSSAWLGAAWKSALGNLGLDGLEVARGGLRRSRWSDLVCFAGVGPGELLWRGRKLVGLSQRRTREGARFLTVCPIGPIGPELTELFSLKPEERSDLLSSLQSSATCLEEAFSGDPAGGDLYERVTEAVVDAVCCSGL